MAGWRPGSEGSYVHLSGPAAFLQTNPRPDMLPYLSEANARLTDWQVQNGGRQVQFKLQGHVPLEFALANAERCSVSADGRALAAQRRDGALTHFRLSAHAATIELRCRLA